MAHSLRTDGVQTVHTPGANEQTVQQVCHVHPANIHLANVS